MRRLFLSLLFALIANVTFAQFYAFDYFSDSYVEFDDGTPLDDIFAEDNQYISIEESLMLYDKHVDNYALLIGKNGFLVNSTDDDGFALDPFVADLVRRDSSSSVSVKVENNGSEGYILKVQWKNVGLEGHDSGDFANFQLWVYLESQQIEFRYGPSQITSTEAFGDYDGPQIVIALLTPDFKSAKDIQIIVGEQSKPEILQQGYNKYTGAPDDGLVMRFRDKRIVSTATVNISEIPVSFYPNPTSDFLNVSGDLNGQEDLVIRDINGRKVFYVKGIGERRIFDVSDLQPGLYMVELSGCVPIKYYIK